MRRLTLLVVVTIVCWGFAMACSGGGVPQSPDAASGTGAASGPGASGQVNPPAPGGGGSIDGGGGEIAPLLPDPVMTATIDGKSIVQDGVYAATELNAHASDAKGQATTFHWSLTGSGIDGGKFADGADATFPLPVVADKAAYELTAIGSLGGKAVHQTINFFTVPKPAAKIVANVNQAAGLPVLLTDGGAVLKGQKVQFSADAKFADTFKWKIVKNNGAATDFDPSKEFIASDVASYKVLLMAFGPGGNTGLQPQEFKFDVKDNAVAITVISQVTKAPDYTSFLKAGGQYPVGATLILDASGIGDALKSTKCSVTNAANVAVQPTKQSVSQYEFTIDTTGDYLLSCTYALKAEYVPLQGDQLETIVGFNILPKTVAKMTVNGLNCNPATALLFEVGKTVTLSAATSTGNISSYSWFAQAGALTDGDKINASLKLNDATGHPLTLSLKGIGDSDSVSCVVYAQPIPNAVIALASTVKDGRSYISGSYQRAHASMTKGVADTFDWSLSTTAGAILAQKSLQNAKDVFEFALNDFGTLTLKLMYKVMDLVGASNSIALNSKSGQVSLITPVDFSNIQSIAAVSDTDVYFASPSAIFHKGVDGRVVQVKNLAAVGDVHPAMPDGFFARNAGDIYLLTTDGGYWRYQFKNGWTFTPMNLGTNVYGLSATGTPAGNLLVVAASNSRLFEVTADTGAGKFISGGAPKLVTMLGNDVYTAAAVGKVADPMVMRCVASTCTKLTWAAGSAPAVDVAWKAIGAGNMAVYLSGADGWIYTINNNLVTKLGFLGKVDYVVAFSRPDIALFAIGNNGDVYRITSTGPALFYSAPATVTHAAGIGYKFWVRDDVGQPKVVQLKSATTQSTLLAQKVIGTPAAPCVDQKQMWMVGETAYVSVCNLNNNSPRYEVWSAPYNGNIAPVSNSEEAMPIVAIGPDDAGGLLIMRSDGTKSFVKQLKSDGMLQALTIPLAQGEVLTGMSGRFFITNQGIILNDGKNYPQVNVLADAHHPFAVGDVLYFSYKSDARLAKFDLKSNTLVDMANVDPQDPVDPGPIADIVVDVNGRIYVLTPKALYRFDDPATLTKLYETPGSLLNSMANMNGRHMLVSRSSKGAVLVELDKPAGPVELFPNMEVGDGVETWGVGYNGTEFLLSGRNLLTKALILYQFGAPQ